MSYWGFVYAKICVFSWVILLLTGCFLVASVSIAIIYGDNLKDVWNELSKTPRGRILLFPFLISLAFNVITLCMYVVAKMVNSGIQLCDVYPGLFALLVIVHIVFAVIMLIHTFNFILDVPEELPDKYCNLKYYLRKPYIRVCSICFIVTLICVVFLPNPELICGV